MSAMVRRAGRVSSAMQAFDLTGGPEMFGLGSRYNRTCRHRARVRARWIS
jgi:hypothetical protein